MAQTLEQLQDMIRNKEQELALTRAIEEKGLQWLSIYQALYTLYKGCEEGPLSDEAMQGFRVYQQKIEEVVASGVGREIDGLEQELADIRYELRQQQHMQQRREIEYDDVVDLIDTLSAFYQQHTSGDYIQDCWMLRGYVLRFCTEQGYDEESTLDKIDTFLSILVGDDKK